MFDLVSHLPKVISYPDLSRLTVDWRDSFSTLARKYGAFPPEGLVAEMLLITRVNGVPMIQRSSLYRRSKHFDVMNSYVSFHDFTGPGAHVFFSGLCRQMITSSNGDGVLIAPTFPLRKDDQAKLDEAWAKLHQSQGSDAIARALLGFENVFTAIDQNAEGPHAGIGGPYAWANFDLAKDAWQTHFNDECTSVSNPESAVGH